jgi:hypothetical protein
VTFITATQYLESHHVAYGGHMAAAMASMESPAIVIGVLFAHLLRKQAASASAVGVSGGSAALVVNGGPPLTLGHLLRDAFTDGAQLLAARLDGRRHPERGGRQGRDAAVFRRSLQRECWRSFCWTWGC